MLWGTFFRRSLRMASLVEYHLASTQYPSTHTWKVCEHSCCDTHLHTNSDRASGSLLRRRLQRLRTDVEVPSWLPCVADVRHSGGRRQSRPIPKPDLPEAPRTPAGGRHSWCVRDELHWHPEFALQSVSAGRARGSKAGCILQMGEGGPTDIRHESVSACAATAAAGLFR